MKKNFKLFQTGFLLGLLLVLTTAFAQSQSETPDLVPAYQPPPVQSLAPVVLPHQDMVLKNGLKVVVVNNDETPVISLRLMAKAGSFYDPPNQAGITQFMSGLLTQGTEKYNAIQIAQKIDFVGGNLSAGSNWDASYIECSVLTKYLDTAEELMRDVALHPIFANDEIERLRMQTLSGIKTSRDQPENVADEEYDRWLFGDYPYGHPLEGTEESVAAFTHDDVMAQYRKIFLPNNALLAVIGDVSIKEGFKIAERMFGAWTPGTVPSTEYSTPSAPQGYRVHLVDKPDATQAQIRFGHLGVARNNGDFFPLTVMNYILGGGGFASRLTLIIRAKMGLTYGIGSSFVMHKLPGAFTVETFTKNESTLESIQESIKLIKQYIAEGPTEKELEEAKSYLTGSYPLNFETPSQMAGQLQNVELFGLGSDYIEKYRSRVAAVTTADVQRVARDYLHPDDLKIVVVSKAEDVKSSLEALGPVEVLDIK